MWLIAAMIVGAVHGEKNRTRVAVCVAGAVRSLIDDRVMTSLARFYGQSDFYYHLFTGIELSARGQRSTDARQLHKALEKATAVRFQTTENPTTCNQMTTGRFFKIEQCAKMVATTGRRYDVLALTRPDLEYNRVSKPSIHPFLRPNKRPWFRAIGDELYLASFDDGLRRASTLTKARCCSIPKRFPPQCFLRNEVLPRANFIAFRHFSHLPQASSIFTFRDLPYHILRTREQQNEIHGRSVWQLHGKTRPGVNVSSKPLMSPPFDNWSDLPTDVQLNIIERFLGPPSESNHTPGVVVGKDLLNFSMATAFPKSSSESSGVATTPYGPSLPALATRTVVSYLDLYNDTAAPSPSSRQQQQQSRSYPRPSRPLKARSSRRWPKTSPASRQPRRFRPQR